MLMSETTKYNLSTQQPLLLPVRNERIDEVAMWARALLIYCRPNQLIRRGGSNQDYNAVPEAMVIRESLLMMIGLCNRVIFELNSPKPKDHNDTEDLQNSFARLASQLRTLREMMGGLSHQDNFTLQSFSSVARAIRREFLECPVLNAELVSTPIADAPPTAAKVIPAIKETLLGSILVDCSGMLFYSLRVLQEIERHLNRDGILKRCLPLFALVLDCCRRSVGVISRRIVERPGLPDDIKDGVDAAVYCLELEARKVSEHELVGVASLRNTIELYAHIENANGILRDAIQQAIVGMFSTMAKGLNGETIFPTFSTKLEQSFKLRDEIWRLLARVKHFEREPQPARVNRLIQAVMAFREDSLKFLMFKDWELYYNLVEELTVARSLRELLQGLHKFGTFLETLLGQINLRAVLLNHPFDYPEVAIED